MGFKHFLNSSEKNITSFKIKKSIKFKILIIESI